MPDVTMKSFDELEKYTGDTHGAEFLYAGKGLGVTAWGMNVERLPAHWDKYPEHDHSEDGQEEVYIVLEGRAVIHADGDSWTLEPGTIARVGPAQKRRLVPGDEGATLLVLGGTPGKAYEPKSG
jgi:mannose-6-phosphate isomerase-like protein (cupin superfamily)